jgi:glycosyltransferase involved in cell wall biosynthesis
MLTAVIPTLNRPADLVKAVASVCNQIKCPGELIIVDQSSDNVSKIAVKNMLKKNKKINLIYIHDSKILGLVDAKRISIQHSTGDIICFLEDDVILEPDYLQQIEIGFLKNPHMIGCSGFITNQPNASFFYKIIFNIFHRGIFNDQRINLEFNYNGSHNKLIPSNMLSGGVSAWRLEVFRKIPFDVKNDFHMFEDIDFSTRVARHFGNRLFINPNAKLAHYFSPINRDKCGVRQRRKLRECVLFFRKRKNWEWATLSFFWLLLGMFFEAIFQSFSSKSAAPIRGFFLGLFDGVKRRLYD